MSPFKTHSRLDSPMACSWSSLKDIFWLSTQRNMDGGFTWHSVHFPILAGCPGRHPSSVSTSRLAKECVGLLWSSSPSLWRLPAPWQPCGNTRSPVMMSGRGGMRISLKCVTATKEPMLMWPTLCRFSFSNYSRDHVVFLLLFQASQQIVPTWYYLSPDPPWLRSPSFSHALVLCSHFDDRPQKPPDRDMPLTDWEEWLQEAFNKRQRVEQENSCSISPWSLCLCHPISCLWLRNVFSCIYAGKNELFDVLDDNLDWECPWTQYPLWAILITPCVRAWAQ